MPDVDPAPVLGAATAALHARGFDHITLQPEGAPCGQCARLRSTIGHR